MKATAKRRDSAGRERVVKDFDFRRPNKLSREHVRTLTLLMDSFARGVATQVSSQLRCISKVTVLSVEQRTWDEYVQESPAVGNVSILRLAPLPGASLLYLPAELSFTVIEMLMGGGGAMGEPTPERGLTEIETTLIRGFTERLLPELRLAFDHLVTVVPTIIGVESSPQFAQIAGPTDLVVVIELELTIDRLTSKASLCIPFQSLQQSLEETSAQLQLANMQVDVERSRVRMLNRTAEVTIEVAARLQAASISSVRLSSLKEGDVLHLGVRTDEPLTLWVGERATHRVTAGKRGRKTAVEIASPMLLDETAFTDTLRG